MSSLSDINVSTGAVMITSKALVSDSAKADVSSGGLLIVMEEDQTMADVLEILKEHNRAKLERDRLHMQPRR